MVWFKDPIFPLISKWRTISESGHILIFLSLILLYKPCRAYWIPHEIIQEILCFTLKLGISLGDVITFSPLISLGIVLLQLSVHYDRWHDRPSILMFDSEYYDLQGVKHMSKLQKSLQPLTYLLSDPNCTHTAVSKREGDSVFPCASAITENSRLLHSLWDWSQNGFVILSSLW